MAQETDFIFFFFHYWGALSHFPPSLPPRLSKKPLVSQWTTDLVRSRRPMGFLIVRLWYLGKDWDHTWAFPHKAWLTPAYFHITKDIHSFLISLPLGIIQLQLAVRLSLTREGRRQRDTQACVQGVIICLGKEHCLSSLCFCSELMSPSQQAWWGSPRSLVSLQRDKSDESFCGFN